MQINRAYFESLFSVNRMQRYFDRFPGDEKRAIQLYNANIHVSASFYMALATLEITFRNKLDACLTNHYGTKDWCNSIKTDSQIDAGLKKKITTAEQQIIQRGEVVSTSKIIAELTFGFWTSLLNSKYEKIYWKSLRNAFPNLPKINKQRHTVSSPINKIRNFRNRIFHHEPITWNTSALKRQHDTICLVLNWMDQDILDYLSEIDHVDKTIRKTEYTVYKQPMSLSYKLRQWLIQKLDY